MIVQKTQILFTFHHIYCLWRIPLGRELTINREEIGVLESLGLSSIQAKAYLALTRLGRAKAGEIGKNAGVARQDVYRVLDKLQESGLIEKIVCSPTEYVPT